MKKLKRGSKEFLKSLEIEKSKIAAITAVLIHVNRGNENYNQGMKNQNIWAFEHRRKIMGLRGVREMKNSRTTWR